MKQSSKAGFYAMAAGVALALMVPAAQAHAKGCSNATLKGSYADKDTGWFDGVGTFAAVNLDSFDGNGNLTMNGWASLNGTVVPNQGSFTYVVNADCTGTYTNQDGSIQAFFVIDNNGNELQIVITNNGTAITCVAKKQYPADSD